MAGNLLQQALSFVIDPGTVGTTVQANTSFTGGDIGSDVLSIPSFDQTNGVITGDTNGQAEAGDTLAFTVPAGTDIVWFKQSLNSGNYTKLAQGAGATLTITEAMTQEGNRIVAVARLADNTLIKSEVIDLFDEIDDCPGGGASGGQGTFTRVIDVGSAYPASFNFVWTAYTIQDRFVISGAATYDTGFVSGSNVSVSVAKTSADRYITVTVYAPTGGTAWNYSVGCAS